MLYYNNILCISASELIISPKNPKGVISRAGYDSWVLRKRINVVRRGGGANCPALIEFDSLPPKYKVMVKERFGDLEAEGQQQGIMKYLEHDKEAAKYFGSHLVTYDDGERGLPPEVQTTYCNNAAVLNALSKAWNEHVVCITGKNRRPLTSKFWGRSSVAIQTLPNEWQCDLPRNPKRLRAKMDEYLKNGYSAILSGKWGNKNTAKITEEVGEWLIAQFSSRINIVTTEQLCTRYNEYAPKMGWKTIENSATIYNYLHRPNIEPLWYAARYGELAYKEKYTRQHKTNLPTMRDSLWYSDGTKLNFFYQDENGTPRTCSVYEVVDVYSERLLGYHISHSENFEAQYLAFKMAIKTAGHKPYELKYDNQGGHKKLESGEFLNNLARHAVRTAPYNGKSKTIESIFGRFQSGYLHEEWYFSGQNITAGKQESRANMEFILSNLKNLPTLEEVKRVYAAKREKWNNALHPKQEVSRIELYKNSRNEDTDKVDFLDMLSLFGITTKEPSTYRASGISIDVKKKTYEYEVLTADGMPDNDFMRKNIGRRFHVRYDLDDMSVVSLYEKDASGMRFVTIAQPYIRVQRNLQEQTPADIQFIRQMEVVNKLQRIENAKQINERLEKYDLHPNQHGLNVPKIKGINLRKKSIDIGEIQKEVSQMTAIDEIRRREKRTAKKAVKQAEKKKATDQRDFYRERIKLLEQTLS